MLYEPYIPRQVTTFAYRHPTLTSILKTPQYRLLLRTKKPFALAKAIQIERVSDGTERIEAAGACRERTIQRAGLNTEMS
jgi:hypothetical protein